MRKKKVIIIGNRDGIPGPAIEEFESNVYDDQIGMIEMVLDIDYIVNEMTTN
ncbi:hypothetical protein [Terrisporobacter glycolicus]|uniref:hypothetical protein n=1 Tax=Terrisporobacter glycolicus TaxID=36841 RepID=UPI001FA7FED8